MSNAGQTCVGVERVYVVESVYQRVPGQAEPAGGGAAAGRRPGRRLRADDAGRAGRRGRAAPGRRAGRGGRAVVGGLDSVQAPYVSPVVLVDVPAESSAMREETFGPVVTVTPVPSLDDGVRLANASSYALGSAVFTRRRQAGLRGRAGAAGRDDLGELGGLVRRGARAAVRRERRVRVRADPRGGRAARVLPGQVDHPAADEAGGATTTFRRTQADMDRIVKLVTVLHGRLYRPRRGARGLAGGVSGRGGHGTASADGGQRAGGRRVLRDQRAPARR